MSLIFPIPSGRSSDLLVQRRLLMQAQSDQLALLKVQTQISTGRRISRPSEDPHSAERAIGLQRILEDKNQSRTNLNTTNSYLAATDTAIASLSGQIAEMRGLAVSSAQTTLSSEQLEANAEQVQRAVQNLIGIGNHQFRGRYLFAGSQTTTPPFALDGDSGVRFDGNETTLRSYAETDFLYSTNISADQVFGVLSPTVRGAVDLNPVLTEQTRLAELRGGQGVRRGSFVVSDGTSSRTIDISSAETIGDVKRLIESNPPTGRTLSVRVTTSGLTIALDSGGGGNLQITETGGDTTASELGIRQSSGGGSLTVVGGDLNPRLALTTPLADLLGTRASGLVTSTGRNNDLVVEAIDNGTGLNGAVVQFVDDAYMHASPPLTAGNERVTYTAVAAPAQAALKFSGFNNNLLLSSNALGTSMNNVRIDLVDAGAIGNAATVNYDPLNKVLTIGVDSANSTTVLALTNALAAEGTFSAGYDPSDSVDGGLLPGATILASDARAGFSDTSNSGADANTLRVYVQRGRSTANQVIDAINDDPLVGELFSARLDAADTTTTVNRGLGVVDIDAIALLEGGAGETLDQTSGLTIQNGGVTTTVDVSSARTVEELLNLLNSSDAKVIAAINANADGIDIRSRLSGGDFAIGENGGTTATQLGVRSFGLATTLAEMNYGRGVGTIDGPDFKIVRSDGVTLDIDVDPTTDLTIGDLLDKINAAGGVVARLASHGNGIEIEDAAGGASPFSIVKQHLSEVAWDLGLVTVGQTQASGVGSPPKITGRDTNPQEVEGIFNSLIRLETAMRSGDIATIERTASLLDDDLKRLNFGRAELGARLQGLDVLQVRLDDEEVELQTTLTNEIDVDLAEAISYMIARQAALEASLRLTARVFDLTLLNFL